MRITSQRHFVPGAITEPFTAGNFMIQVRDQRLTLELCLELEKLMPEQKVLTRKKKICFLVGMPGLAISEKISIFYHLLISRSQCCTFPLFPKRAPRPKHRPSMVDPKVRSQTQVPSLLTTVCSKPGLNQMKEARTSR